ncbi:hypothetical protein DI291_0365 [Bacillus paralicheniformis]|nr:hypothetical protein DI291_0365 [Bacillus paralicheniformis]
MNGCCLKRESIFIKKKKQADCRIPPAVFDFVFFSCALCVKMKEEKIFRQIHVPRFVKSHFESKNRENQKKTEKKREIPLLLEKSFLKKGNKVVLSN